jgi:hypothetical protein
MEVCQCIRGIHSAAFSKPFITGRHLEGRAIFCTANQSRLAAHTFPEPYNKTMSGEEQDYAIETADAGASATIPMEAGQIKKGGYVCCTFIVSIIP